MDESKLALQLLNLQITECKKQDLQKKLNITVNIARRSECDIGPIKNIDDVADLTGVSSQTLEKLKKLEETSIQFEDWEAERKIEYDVEFYNKIKVCLLNHYTRSHEIPTRQRILKLLIKSDQHCSEIQGHLKKFFTNLKLPSTESSIIVEKPEIIRKRFHYFDTKLMYQKEDRNIVYIGGACMSRKNAKIQMTSNMYGNNERKCLMAVSTKSGYINLLFNRGVGVDAVKSWLFDEIFPTLKPESVIIFCQKLYFDDEKPPNINASKEEMSDWLQNKDIPHSRVWHKAELYLLIEKYKRTTDSEASNVKDHLTARGHTVLQKPGDVECCFYDIFWNHLRKLLTSKKFNTKLWTQDKDMQHSIITIASSLSVNYWKNLETKLLEKELEDFKADLKMEVVIDKLLAYTEHEDFRKKVALDLDPYQKHLEEEYIFTI